MGSTLTVDNIVGATSASAIKIPGHVIQVVNAEKTDTVSAGSTAPTFTDTGLSCTITPKFSNSKILVHVNAGLGISTSVFNNMRVVRNVGGGAFSMISVADSAGSRTAAHACVYDADNQGMVYMQDFIHLDSPATTSAVIYKVQLASSGGGTIYLNRSTRDSNGTAYDIRTSSRIILQEIAQ